MEYEQRIAWERAGRPGARAMARQQPGTPRSTWQRLISRWREDDTGAPPEPLDVDPSDDWLLRLQLLRARAVRAIEALLCDTGAPPAVQLGAARDVLDRCGARPPKRAQLRHMADEDLVDEIVRRTAAAKRPPLRRALADAGLCPAPPEARLEPTEGLTAEQLLERISRHL